MGFFKDSFYEHATVVLCEDASRFLEYVKELEYDFAEFENLIDVNSECLYKGIDVPYDLYRDSFTLRNMFMDLDDAIMALIDLLYEHEPVDTFDESYDSFTEVEKTLRQMLQEVLDYKKTINEIEHEEVLQNA